MKYPMKVASYHIHAKNYMPTKANSATKIIHDNFTLHEMLFNLA